MARHIHGSEAQIRCAAAMGVAPSLRFGISPDRCLEGGLVAQDRLGRTSVKISFELHPNPEWAIKMALAPSIAVASSVTLPSDLFASLCMAQEQHRFLQDVSTAWLLLNDLVVWIGPSRACLHCPLRGVCPYCGATGWVPNKPAGAAP